MNQTTALRQNNSLLFRGSDSCGFYNPAWIVSVYQKLCKVVGLGQPQTIIFFWITDQIKKTITCISLLVTARQGSLALHLQEQQKQVKDLSRHPHTRNVASSCLPGPRRTSDVTGSSKVNYFLSSSPRSSEGGRGLRFGECAWLGDSRKSVL